MAPQLAVEAEAVTLDPLNLVAAIRSSLPGPPASVPIVVRSDTSRPTKSMNALVPCPPPRSPFRWWQTDDRPFLASDEASAQQKRSHKKRVSVLSMLLHNAAQQDKKQEKETARERVREEKEKAKAERAEKKRNAPPSKTAQLKMEKARKLAEQEALEREKLRRRQEFAEYKRKVREEQAHQELEKQKSSGQVAF